MDKSMKRQLQVVVHCLILGLLTKASPNTSEMSPTLHGV